MHAARRSSFKVSKASLFPLPLRGSLLGWFNQAYIRVDKERFIGTSARMGEEHPYLSRHTLQELCLLLEGFQLRFQLCFGEVDTVHILKEFQH